MNVINNTTGRHCSVTFINLNQWSPHVLIFLFRYLDDVALHHLVDALCRLSTTSMEQAQSNKVINFPSPQSSLLRAVCAFRVTCSERVFFRPIVSDTSPKYIDREGLGVSSGWAGDWVAVVSSCIMGLSWVGYRFFSLAVTKFRGKLDPNLCRSAIRRKTHTHYQAKVQNGLFP